MGDKPVTMESLMAVLMEVKEMNKKHQEEIIKLSSKVIVLEKENIVLKKEVRSLKESANRHEQATRILTVRILGMPISTEESSSAPADRNKVAVSTVYENIINPRILIVEDLTPATIKKMKELREDDRVEKVWSTEGVIRFTLVSDPSKVRKCPGVFTPINEIIK